MNKGFTLLEVLIVVIVVSLVIPMIASLFIINIQSFSRVKILQQVKNNGDFVMDIIEQKVRNDVWAIYSNASATDEVCSTKSSSYTADNYTGALYFRDRDQMIFYLSDNNGTLEFTNNAVTSSLTNNQVIADTLTMSCSRSSVFVSPVINIAFSLQQRYGSKYHDQARLTYSTKFKGR